MGGCDAVRHVVIYKRTGSPIHVHASRDLWWHDLVQHQPDVCEPVWVNAEHPLFILYTSGSTGKPKGVQHSTGGYLLQAMLTMKWVFDYKPSDVFWCTADVGWVTGHTYVAYGPLAVGATEVVFEGVPTYPDAGRFWKMIQEHKVSVFYTAPTAIRSLIKLGGDLPKKYDLSSLRLLGTVGEPINPEAWMWYYDTVGNSRCPIVDTWWQTETGGHMITPLPGATPLKPAPAHLPLPGIMAAIVDETGHDVEKGKGGILVIKKPWPAMIRTIWGDPERYKKSYYPDDFKGKYYLAGDGANRDLDGYFWIMGRIDDVLNVSGHRLGTMEIESALVANPLVAEAAVVGKPHEIKGEAVVAYVVLKGARPWEMRPRKWRRNCATGSPRKSARSPSPTKSASATTCPRPVPARSCAGCCARSPRARTSRRMSRRWRTRGSWSNSSRLLDAAGRPCFFDSIATLQVFFAPSASHGTPR